MDQEGQQDAQKRERLQNAIDAREHAEQYKNDSDAANREADEAEQAIDNPPQ